MGPQSEKIEIVQAVIQYYFRKSCDLMLGQISTHTLNSRTSHAWVDFECARHARCDGRTSAINGLA